MNKKGFTLIELLAVIVVLAIIALIATPMVLNTIEDARKGAAQSSALTYISEVEKQIAINMMDEPGTTLYQSTTITNTDFVTVKGDTPSSMELIISDGVVQANSKFTINGYAITYDGKNATVDKAE